MPAIAPKPITQNSPLRAAARRRRNARVKRSDPERVYWIKHRPGGVAKRLFDLAGACAALIVGAPFVLAISAAIKLEDGGPILFKQRRIGHGGRAFFCLKFRTMAVDAEQSLARHLKSNPLAAAEWSSTRKLRRDPRITRVGHFLRKTSLDELPQILNILRGEMSIVGPRPVTREEISRYGLDRVYYLSARPGLTGLWQISGRSDVLYAARVLLDRRYVREWSFLRDLSIIFLTVPALLAARGAY